MVPSGIDSREEKSSDSSDDADDRKLCKRAITDQRQSQDGLEAMHGLAWDPIRV